MMIPSFTNSEAWMFTSPRRSQRVEPPTVCPTNIVQQERHAEGVEQVGAALDEAQIDDRGQQERGAADEHPHHVPIVLRAGLVVVGVGLRDDAPRR